MPTNAATRIDGARRASITYACIRFANALSAAPPGISRPRKSSTISFRTVATCGFSGTNRIGKRCRNGATTERRPVKTADSATRQGAAPPETSTPCRPSPATAQDAPPTGSRRDRSFESAEGSRAAHAADSRPRRGDSGPVWGVESLDRRPARPWLATDFHRREINDPPKKSDETGQITGMAGGSGRTVAA